MALVSLKQLVTDASRRQYAVGSFNVVNMDTLKAILEGAEENASPVILSVAEAHFGFIDLEEFSPIILRAAEKAKVPVAVHLDHGQSFPALVKALRHGFTSVMFDGSILPLEENIAKTKEITRMAHAVDVSVEAELGHVTGGEGDSSPGVADPSLFTDPEEAKRFVAETKVDALAVAVGSVHGIYKGTPELDIPRLAKIRDLAGVPLVLHGGSGLSDDDFQQAITHGIAKINVYTDMSQAAMAKIRTVNTLPETLGFPEFMSLVHEAIKEAVTKKMQIFGSVGKAR
jgi:fructose-bisphosphate aldolase class II